MTTRPRMDARPSSGPSTTTSGSAGTRVISPRAVGGPKAAGVRRWRVRQALFVAVDGVAAAAAVLLTGGGATAAVAFAGAAMMVDLFDRGRANRLSLSALDDAPALILRGLLISGLAFVADLPISGHEVPGARQGAGWVVTALVFAVLAISGRGIGFAVIRRIQAGGQLASPALIIGASSVGTAIGHRLQAHPEYGLVTVGYVDSAAHSADALPAPLLGDVPDLPRLVVQHGIGHVIVAFAGRRDDDMVDLLRACDRLDCEIFVVPRLFELGVGVPSAPDHVWGIPLMRLHRAAFRSRAWTGKRILDVELASLALVLLSPVMLAIAFALRREVGRNVLFRQARVGLDGRTFELLKFRTLRPAKDDEPAGFCVISPDRLGPVGRFLRRSSLDELPQLWNVLRGQMSLVGPRPEQSHFVRRFVRKYPGYRQRLRVPAGVTGLAQVEDLRGAGPIDDRVCFDNFYIEHWSLWQDIKILVRTVASVVRMRGR